MSKTWNREASKDKWHRRRAAGQCGRCGGVPEEGRAQCRPCADATAKANLARWRAKHPDAGSYTTDSYLSPRDKAMLANGRCERCHLLKPCVCLPTIQELATARVGEGGRAPGGTNHGGTSKQGARC